MCVPCMYTLQCSWHQNIVIKKLPPFPKALSDNTFSTIFLECLYSKTLLGSPFPKPGKLFLENYFFTTSHSNAVMAVAATINAKGEKHFSMVLRKRSEFKQWLGSLVCAWPVCAWPGMCLAVLSTPSSFPQQTMFCKAAYPAVHLRCVSTLLCDISIIFIEMQSTHRIFC